MGGSDILSILIGRVDQVIQKLHRIPIYLYITIPSIYSGMLQHFLEEDIHVRMLCLVRSHKVLLYHVKLRFSNATDMCGMYVCMKILTSSTMLNEQTCCLQLTDSMGQKDWSSHESKTSWEQPESVDME